jgi:hypothetical protein
MVPAQFVDQGAQTRALLDRDGRDVDQTLVLAGFDDQRAPAGGRRWRMQVTVTV